MRALGYVMLAVVLFWAPAPCSAMDFDAQTGLHYRAWTSDADESGDQFYLPLILHGTVRQLSWDIVAGYASTTGDLAGNGDRSISGPLDTQLNLAYELTRAVGLDWLFGLDLNLPTGKTDENDRDLRIMLDPDLVPIVSPGQGFNINPYVNLARHWNAWTFGIGAGYAFQGKYDYSSDHQDYDPGDIFNVTAETLYDWGGGWQTRLFGQYATYGTDTESGQDLLKRGDTLLMGAGVQYQRDAWALALTLQAILRAKSEYRQAAAAGIETEAHNSNGDEWIADFSSQYRLRDSTTFNAALSYMFVAANDYDESSAFFAGQRTKTALALGLTQQLSEKASLQGGLEGFIMDDDKNWLHPDGDRTYHGWTISLEFNQRF